MQNFITLNRRQPEFESYLRGDFSRSQVALPVRSLHINSAQEQVTFQIFTQEEIERPSLSVILVRLARLDLFTFTFSPVMVTLAYARAEVLSWSLVGWALTSLLFLHAALFAHNDFVDHIYGVDRLSEKGGSQVIQRGWLRAHTVQKLFYALCILAVLSAFPLFLAQPLILAASAVAALFGILAYPTMRWSRRHWLFAPVVLFLCLGPLLSAAAGWTLTAKWHPAVLLMGAYFGLLAVVYVQLRQMVGMVVDDEAGLRTLPVRFGFDRSKIIVVGLLVLAFSALGSMAVAYWWTHAMQSYPATITMLLLWGFGYALTRTALRVARLQSPLSSALVLLPRAIIRLHLLSALAFIGLLLW